MIFLCNHHSDGQTYILPEINIRTFYTWKRVTDREIEEKLFNAKALWYTLNLYLIGTQLHLTNLNNPILINSKIFCEFPFIWFENVSWLFVFFFFRVRKEKKTFQMVLCQLFCAICVSFGDAQDFDIHKLIECSKNRQLFDLSIGYLVQFDILHK